MKVGDLGLLQNLAGKGSIYNGSVAEIVESMINQRYFDVYENEWINSNDKNEVFAVELIPKHPDFQLVIRADQICPYQTPTNTKQKKLRRR